MKRKLLIFLLAVISAFCQIGFTACRVEGGGSSTGQTQTGGNASDTEELSDIAKVLAGSSYYRSLIDECAQTSLRVTQKMYPAPYKFLRNEGLNVDAYIFGDMKLLSTPFMYKDEPNNLYISVKAECPSSHFRGNYYENYILKYQLSDKESQEFMSLCEDGYLQGLLYVQELDNQRSPTIVSENKIAVISYDTIVKQDSGRTPAGYKDIDVDIIYTSVEDELLHYIIRKKTRVMYSTTFIYNYELKLDLGAMDTYYDNNVYFVSAPGYAQFLNDYKTDYREGYTFGTPIYVDNLIKYSNKTNK